MRLRRPDSYLNGRLWCSGIPAPRKLGPARFEGGGGQWNLSGSAAGREMQVQHADGRRDSGRLRLGHWTLLASSLVERDQKLRGGGALLIQPRRRSAISFDAATGLASGP